MEIWVVAYRRFYKVFLVSMALFLGGNMVPQKIESRRRKNNSRQQKIIYYLLRACWRNFQMTKTTYVGVSMEGATPFHWGILPASTAKILKLSQVLIWICLYLQVQCIHIWSNKSKPFCSDGKCGCCEKVTISKSLILSFDCISLDKNSALYLLLILLTFLLPEELE